MYGDLFTTELEFLGAVAHLTTVCVSRLFPNRVSKQEQVVRTDVDTKGV
jgi:hypothetical protein